MAQIRHHHLTAWRVSTNWEVGHSYFFFSDTGLESPHVLGCFTDFQGAIFSDHSCHFLTDHSAKQCRGFKLSIKITKIMNFTVLLQRVSQSIQLLNTQGPPKPGQRPDLAPKAKLRICYSPHSASNMSCLSGLHSLCLALPRGIDWRRERKKYISENVL